MAEPVAPIPAFTKSIFAEGNARHQPAVNFDPHWFARPEAPAPCVIDPPITAMRTASPRSRRANTCAKRVQSPATNCALGPVTSREGTAAPLLNVPGRSPTHVLPAAATTNASTHRTSANSRFQTGTPACRAPAVGCTPASRRSVFFSPRSASGSFPFSVARAAASPRSAITTTNLYWCSMVVIIPHRPATHRPAKHRPTTHHPATFRAGGRAGAARAETGRDVAGREGDYRPFRARSSATRSGAATTRNPRIRATVVSRGT